MWKADSRKPIPDAWAWALVMLIIVAAGLTRFRLLDFPLERDEGEYAYAGQLLLEGVLPYEQAWNLKLPGTYFAYAGLMAVFGQTTEGVHLGVILVTSATAVLVFLLARRRMGASTGVAACAVYAVLALSLGVQGLAGHATHLVTLFSVAGMLMLVIACDSGRRWAFPLSGMLLGLAFMMKQHGVFLLMHGVLYALVREWQRQPRQLGPSTLRLTLLGFGILLPVGVTFVILAIGGVWERFWFWTFTYAQEYVTQMSLAEAQELFVHQLGEVIGPNWLLWLMAGTGLLTIWREPLKRPAAWMLASWLLFAFLAVCPGLYFRGHYFIVMLPVVAMLAGAGMQGFGPVLLRLGVSAGAASVLPMLMLLAGLGWSLFRQAEVLYFLGPVEACRAVYGGNPFAESIEVGRYIERHSQPTDRIAVLGSEPQIGFHANRRSCTGYLYTYGLMEDHPFAEQMQREMIAEIEAGQPRFLVVVHTPTSWLLQSNSSRSIFDWSDRHIAEHYDLVGVVDIEAERTTYRWGAQAVRYKPRSDNLVMVYRRRVD
jgi:hypothetical protein